MKTAVEQPKLSANTIKKLTWLKARLRKYPHRYDQSNWCGQQACLAGYCIPRIIGLRKVIIGSDDPNNGLQWAEWLGVTDGQAWLLDASEWYGPARKFNRRKKDTDEEAVEKACQRIDLFIESGGTK